METRQYRLTIERRDGYLFARAQGERTRATVAAITLEVVGVAEAGGIDRALIDVRALEGRLSVLDSYLVVTQVFERLRGGALHKGAVVDVQISSQREWFIETVARNRGFNFRVFPNETEALAWLKP